MARLLNIVEEAVLLGDRLVSLKAKRRECSEKTLKLQCLLLRNYRKFKRNRWKGGLGQIQGCTEQRGELGRWRTGVGGLLFTVCLFSTF